MFTTGSKLFIGGTVIAVVAAVVFGLSYDGATAWTAAIGQNREVFGNLEAYLLEGTRRAGKHGGAEWPALRLTQRFYRLGIARADDDARWSRRAGSGRQWKRDLPHRWNPVPSDLS